MKALSKNNAELKLILPLVLLLTANLILLSFLEDHKYLIIFGVLLSFFYLKNRYINTSNIFFSSKYLYLNSKKLKRKIDLKKVSKIKLTLSNMRVLGFQFYRYKIHFQNDNRLNETIFFYTSILKSEIWEFQDLTKGLNKNVEIENYSTSWGTKQ